MAAPEAFLLLLLACAQEPASRPASGPSSAPAPSPSGRAPLDGVAAIVNDEVVTESELAKALAAARETFGFDDPERWQEYRRAKLRSMVLEKLLVQSARRLQIPEATIEERVQRGVEEEIERSGSKANLLERLGQQGKSYEDFLAERHAQEFRLAFIRSELGLEPGPSGRPSIEIYVGPGKMLEHYRAHREEFVIEEASQARQIFLSAERWGGPAAARAKAEEVRGRLLAGEDFAALAREFSDWKPLEGGDLGWVRRSSPYDRAIVDFALGAEAGGLSPVREIQGGVVLVQVLEKRERRVRPFKDPAVQEEISNRLWQDRRQEYQSAAVERLLREAYIWPPDLLLAR